MSRALLYLISGMFGFALAGCASFINDDIHVSEKEKVNANALKARSLASIRIAGYVDGRNTGNPRKIGINEERVFGMSGRDIVLDRDVTDVVADSLRKRLGRTDLQILDKGDANALFELGGVVKELRYDVKARDYVLIRLETTLKEVATGKVVWEGEVAEKADRFAGVSGNTKDDIADYLKQEVGVVTGKTSDAIYAVLMATRPELFNLTPGTKVIPGVKVLVAPGVISTPAPVVPATATPAAGDKSQESSAGGMLVVNTMPDRARVYVDGIYFGMTPLRAETDPGVRMVEVRSKGYKTASEKVSIRKGESTELELTLEH